MSDLKLIGKIKKFFHIYGGSSGLTRQFIYYNMPKSKENSIPVYSGATSKQTFMGYIDKTVDGKIKIFTGPCILISRKGQSGTMRYIDDREFTINDDAYVLYIKDEFKNEIILEWVYLMLQKLFFNIATSKEGNGTFSKVYAEEQEVEIPHKDIQKEEVKQLLLLDKIKSEAISIKEEIEKLLEKIIFHEDMEEFNMSESFYIDTGKRITKEMLYDNLNTSGKVDDNVTIISSGTENEGIFGYASEQWLTSKFRRTRQLNNKWDPWKNYQGADFIINEPCITWNTDGDAGDVFYRDYKFFPTDHCGVLIPKEEFKGKVNLKYFAYLQKYTFKQNTDRANLHKEQMASLKFSLPSIEVQNEIFNKISTLYDYKKVLTDIISSIDRLRNKEIVG